MSIIATLLFAATASASVTTSIRMPGPNYGEAADYSYLGSVVGVNGDKTTLALEYDFGTTSDYFGHNYEAETYTLIGGTRIEGRTSTADIGDGGDFTASVGCDVPSTGKATCTYSENGAYLASMYCSNVKEYATPVTTTYAYTYTSDEYGPATTETYVETYGGLDDFPSYLEPYIEFCSTGGSALPEEIAIATETFKPKYVQNYQVIITAGEEKLKATAGSTPSNSEAKPTGTATGTAATGTATSATGSTDAPQAEFTGAAAPMRALAPALAGLGAAMAAFMW